jgi:hypothetical protein
MVFGYLLGNLDQDMPQCRAQHETYASHRALAEAARRHGYLDGVRKLPFIDDGASATSTSHSFTGKCPSMNRIQVIDECKSVPDFGKPVG